MTNRIQRQKQQSKRWRKYVALAGLVVLVSVAGAWSSYADTQSEVARSSDVPVVAIDDPDAALGVDATASIQENSTQETFATVSNRFDSSATVTVQLTPAASDHVAFVSSPSVSVSSDGSVATVSLAASSSADLFVDVDAGASDSLTTADFEVSGGPDDGTISVSLAEQTGPDVVA